MKKLLKNTVLTSAFLAFFASVSASAKPIALVSKLNGNAFVVFKDSTRQIREGDYLDDFSTVITEEGAMLTLSDFYDHKYHLAGSGMITFLNRIIELKRGYLWVQSFAKGDSHRLQTANAVATYSSGDAILSFEPLTSRTQLLVLNGTFSLKNVLYDSLGVSIVKGKFSFVDSNYDKGIPRIPTTIGSSSHRHLSSIFKNYLSDEYKVDNIKEMREKSITKNSRGVASVYGSEEVGKKVVPGGTVTYRKPYKRKKFNVKSYYSKKVSKIEYERAHRKFRPEYSSKSGVAIRVFGAKKKKSYKRRSIASVKKSVAPKRRRPASIAINPQVTINKRPNPFQGAMMEVYKTEMRNKADSNNLIDDLNSYKKDYRKVIR